MENGESPVELTTEANQCNGDIGRIYLGKQYIVSIIKGFKYVVSLPLLLRQHKEVRKYGLKEVPKLSTTDDFQQKIVEEHVTQEEDEMSSSQDRSVPGNGEIFGEIINDDATPQTVESQNVQQTQQPNIEPEIKRSIERNQQQEKEIKRLKREIKELRLKTPALRGATADQSRASFPVDDGGSTDAMENDSMVDGGSTGKEVVSNGNLCVKGKGVMNHYGHSQRNEGNNCKMKQNSGEWQESSSKINNHYHSSTIINFNYGGSKVARGAEESPTEAQDSAFSRDSPPPLATPYVQLSSTGSRPFIFLIMSEADKKKFGRGEMSNLEKKKLDLELKNLPTVRDVRVAVTTALQLSLKAKLIRPSGRRRSDGLKVFRVVNDDSEFGFANLDGEWVNEEDVEKYDIKILKDGNPFVLIPEWRNVITILPR